MPHSPTPESAILRAVRLAVGALPGVVLWRNSVGVARYVGRGGRAGAVPYGLQRGASDAVGVLSVAIPGIARPVGVALFIEVKSARGRLTEEQALFRDLVVRLGAVHLTVRSAEEAVAGVVAARDALEGRVRE